MEKINFIFNIPYCSQYNQIEYVFITNEKIIR